MCRINTDCKHDFPLSYSCVCTTLKKPLTYAKGAVCFLHKTVVWKEPIGYVCEQWSFYMNVAKFSIDLRLHQRFSAGCLLNYQWCHASSRCCHGWVSYSHVTLSVHKFASPPSLGLDCLVATDLARLCFLLQQLSCIARELCAVL